MWRNFEERRCFHFIRFILFFDWFSFFFLVLFWLACSAISQPRYWRQLMISLANGNGGILASFDRCPLKSSSLVRSSGFLSLSFFLSFFISFILSFSPFFFKMVVDCLCVFLSRFLCCWDFTWCCIHTSFLPPPPPPSSHILEYVPPPPSWMHTLRGRRFFAILDCISIIERIHPPHQDVIPRNRRRIPVRSHAA